MKRRIPLLVLTSAVAVSAVAISAANNSSPSATHVVKATSATTTDAPAKQLWHCGMHPQVIQDHPGVCPICHMALTPIGSVGRASTTATSGGVTSLTIDPAVVQNMGVRTAKVTRGSLARTIRAVGVIKFPEPAMHDVSPRVGGWVEKIYADQEGMGVVEGQPLFDLYSPDLQVAEQELISAVKSAGASAVDGGESAPIIESAKRKLRLWGIADQDIDAVAKADTPPATIPIRSPATGHVEDKAIVQGSAVTPMTKVMRIINHSQMWLEAQVYQNQLNSVKEGLKIRATVEGMPGKEWDGSISFIYPHLDHMSRTLTVRMTIDNPEFLLKPGMYATAQIALDPVQDALQVPREAVIDTGERQIAFVDRGEGHFEARRVQMGTSGADGMVQILSGLAAGETVVTSGQFLLDAESRTIEAIATMGGPPPVALTGPPSSAPVSAPTTTQVSQLGLSVVYCPMVKESWLQRGSDIANPYMDKEMSDCGSIEKTFKPPADPDLKAVIEAYLDVGKALNADRLDIAAQKELLASARDLAGAQYASLRAASAKLSQAHDLKAARAAFSAVSDQLVSLVSKDAGEGAKR